MLVYTNINDDFVRLILKGYVIPTSGKLRSKIGPLVSGANLVEFGDVYKGNTKYETIPIYNATSDTINILPQNNVEFIKTNIKVPKLAPETSSEIYIEFSTKHTDFGKILVPCNFDITINEKTSVAYVSIMANVVQDFSKLSEKEIENPPIIKPNFKKIDLGSIEPDKITSKELEIANKGKRKLIIHRITTTNSMYDIEPDNLIIEPEEKGVFTLKIKPIDTRTNLVSKLTIISNDPTRSSLTYKITGRVQTEERNINPEKGDLKIDLTVSEAVKLIEKLKNKNDFVILDVRTKQEYDAGCLQNAVNLNSSDPDFETLLSLLDKNKTFLVYCKSGYRSKKTIKLMKKMGFTDVHHMFQGIVGWKKMGLKLTDPNP